MGANEATFEAYDGVELRLGQTVVRCPALTTAEAIGYLRLFDRAKDDPAAHAEFLDGFPERMGLAGVPLSDLGVDVEGPDGKPLDLSRLTYKSGTRVAALYGVAAYETDIGRRSRAQIKFLRRFPKLVGIADPDALPPVHVFGAGARFVQDFYLRIYGLAQDFCSHLISGPTSQVMVLRGLSLEPSSSTPVSTT